MHLPRRIHVGRLIRLLKQLFIGYSFYKVILSRWLYRRPRLTHSPSSNIAQRIISSCPSLQSYIPSCYLLGGVMQTLSGESRSVHPHLSLAESTRMEILLPEVERPAGMYCCPDVVPKGMVSIDWVVPQAQDTSHMPVVVLVPGLTGSSQTTYIRTMADMLCSRGVRAACYNPRGRGGNPLDTPFLYSAGYTHDLRRAIAAIHAEIPPNTKMFAVGFSLGSNYLAKYVGEEGDACVLTGAVCCACPTDCLSMSIHLEHSIIGRLMDPLLVSLVQKVRRELEHLLPLNPRLDSEGVREATTMADFDHAIVAPMFGFDTVSDYYRFASCSLHLAAVRRPVLFLHAYNDPIVPGKYIRMDNFRTNPHLLHCMTAEGGHSMVWPTGISCDSWAARVIGEFVSTFV